MSLIVRDSLSFSLALDLSGQPTGEENGATSFLIRPKLLVIGTHRGMKFCGTTAEAAPPPSGAIKGAAHVREKELLTLVRQLIPFPGEDIEQEGGMQGERGCIKF